MARGKYQEWLTDEGLLQLGAWARDGLTDEQIAKNMGISYSTLRVWRDKYSALSAALKKGKDVVDVQVENALLKRALGYTYTEVKTVESAKGTVTTTTVKEVAPDVTAGIFWLKNRQRPKWGDKQVEKTESEENQSITFEIMPASAVRRNDDDNETTSD